MGDEISSNTAPEQQKKKPRGKPFVRGDDRINRKGRARSFDQVRKLAVLVAHEENEEGVSRVLEILRDWSRSKDPKKQALFMEYAFGKVKDEVEHSGELSSKVIIEYSKDNTPATASEPDTGQE